MEKLHKILIMPELHLKLAKNTLLMFGQERGTGHIKFHLIYNKDYNTPVKSGCPVQIIIRY